MKFATNHPALLLSSLVLLSSLGCAVKRSSTVNVSSPAGQKKAISELTPDPAKSSNAKTGEATGSYTAGGETVTLKYAYAGRGQRFGEDSIIVLVTDQPIPTEAVAEEINSQTMLLDKKIRGLEYVFSKSGYWVRFHPSQYQESKSGQPKEYSVENDVIKGSDEDKGDLTNGKYQRTVRFVASISR
jgi:hypothetical protein